MASFGIERFRTRLGRSKEIIGQKITTAQGEKLCLLCDQQEQLIKLIQDIDDLVLPRTAGFNITGCGEATIRASHGGTLEPGRRSNR